LRGELAIRPNRLIGGRNNRVYRGWDSIGNRKSIGSIGRNIKLEIGEGKTSRSEIGELRNVSRDLKVEIAKIGNLRLEGLTKEMKRGEGGRMGRSIRGLDHVFVVDIQIYGKKR
jgi:hypothetical protein